jgi:hypothetical protein
MNWQLAAKALTMEKAMCERMHILGATTPTRAASIQQMPKQLQ